MNANGSTMPRLFFALVSGGGTSSGAKRKRHAHAGLRETHSLGAAYRCIAHAASADAGHAADYFDA